MRSLTAYQSRHSPKHKPIKIFRALRGVIRRVNRRTETRAAAHHKAPSRFRRAATITDLQASKAARPYTNAMIRKNGSVDKPTI